LAASRKLLGSYRCGRRRRGRRLPDGGEYMQLRGSFQAASMQLPGSFQAASRRLPCSFQAASRQLPCASSTTKPLCHAWVKRVLDVLGMACIPQVPCLHCTPYWPYVTLLPPCTAPRPEVLSTVTVARQCSMDLQSTGPAADRGGFPLTCAATHTHLRTHTHTHTHTHTRSACHATHTLDPNS
jgi:hypothetical protein